MSDQSLRDALETLAAGWRYTGDDLEPWQEGGGPDPYESALDFASHQVADLLAAHPAEPPVVTRSVEIPDAAVEGRTGFARSSRPTGSLG